jgi:hypothetical protein
MVEESAVDQRGGGKDQKGLGFWEDVERMEEREVMKEMEW